MCFVETQKYRLSQSFVQIRSPYGRLLATMSKRARIFASPTPFSFLKKATYGKGEDGLSPSPRGL